ncbi:MAG TPA: hypothetical protein VJT84_09440 [Gaiellaceae bacterium]|nr:hypothetical protein [Gaiellaceae bacterium]
MILVYRVIIHAAAPEDEEAALERVRAVLGAAGILASELRVEDGPDDARFLHIEAPLEAPSAYHAAHVSGPELYGPLLAEAGLEQESLTLAADRVSEPAA